LVASPFVAHIPDCDLGLCSLTYFNPDVDRLTVSANAWIRGGFGLAANYARTWSHMPGSGADDDVPFLPRHSARVGLVWQNPSRVTARLSATYTGSRRSDQLDTRLDGFVSADLGVEWETLDRRLLVSAAVSNLLDKQYDIVSGVPGFGRTANLSATLRF
jgi:outer membrane receptor protein involved in Fe transport